MEAFAQAAQSAFATDMVAHLAEFSPPLFKAIREEQMRQAVQFGISQAERYGFTCRGPVRLYLELMLLFGSHFDTDPQYPWAGAIIQRLEIDQMQRAEQLYAQTLDYRNQVAGPDDCYTVQALRNIATLAQQPSTLAAPALVSGLLAEIKQVYPQKAAYVGDAPLTTLIEKGIAGARRQRFTTPREITLVVVLMLAFGHGCGADPLYPWIARTLRDERLSDPTARAKRLETKALTWLMHVLRHFETPASA